MANRSYRNQSLARSAPVLLAGLLFAFPLLTGCVEQSWPPPANPSYPDGPPEIPPAKINIEYNTLRRGGDYAHFRTRNFEACVVECQNDPRCMAMDFNIRDNTCRLKDSVPPAQPSTIIATGVKENAYGNDGYTPYPPQDIYDPGGNIRIRLSRDTTRKGGDYSNFRAANVEECSDACIRDSRCRAFDYGKYSGICWMKNSVPRASRDINTVSGVKEWNNFGTYTPNPPGGPPPYTGPEIIEGMEITRGATRRGGDYAHFSTRNTRECARACSRDYTCRAFDFDKQRKTCWLKNSVPRSRPDGNINSGVKRSENPPPPSISGKGFKISYNTSRNGGDYKHYIAGSLDECSRTCTREYNCRSFNYVVTSRECWLKETVPPARPYRNVISGVKIRY